MRAQLRSLRDGLLRRGVGPRHVTRYLTELSEHLDDLIAEEKRAGHTEANAESAAWSRLGGTDRLLEALVARKDFLSWAHRAPWAVFLLGPCLAAFGITIIGMVALSLLVEVMGSGTEHVPIVVPAYFDPLFTVISAFNIYVLPLLLGWVIAAAAVRQRMKPLWPVSGIVVVALSCGSQSYHIGWAATPNGLLEFGLSWPFIPHGGPWTFLTGAWVIVLVCALASMYTFWNLRQIKTE